MEALLRFRRSVDRAEATFLLRRGASRSPAERPCFVGGITFERRQTNQGRTEENLALAFTSAFMAPALGSRLVTSQTRDQYTRGQFAVRASTLRRSKKSGRSTFALSDNPTLSCAMLREHLSSLLQRRPTRPAELKSRSREPVTRSTPRFVTPQQPPFPLLHAQRRPPVAKTVTTGPVLVFVAGVEGTGHHMLCASLAPRHPHCRAAPCFKVDKRLDALVHAPMHQCTHAQCTIIY
jgi:hypothetical protein